MMGMRKKKRVDLSGFFSAFNPAKRPPVLLYVREMQLSRQANCNAEQGTKGGQRIKSVNVIVFFFQVWRNCVLFICLYSMNSSEQG